MASFAGLSSVKFTMPPNRFYWARRLPAEGAAIFEPNDIEVVRVSTVFGATPEFWTVTVMGSDEHFDLAAFEFFHKAPRRLQT